MFAWLCLAALADEPWLGSVDPEVAEIRLRGSEPFGVFGSRVRMDGDADGDGTVDLLVAAPHEAAMGPRTGSVYLFVAPRTGEQRADEDETAELAGEAAEDWAGFGMDFAGDVDGDGDDDLIIGARLNDRGGDAAGAAYLVLMPIAGDRSLADADGIVIGDAARDQVGLDVSAAGDPDGDGLAELWVSAPYADAGAGRVYLLPGVFRGESRVGLSARAELHGEAPGDMAGLRVVALGDVDGDGRADVGLGGDGSDRNGDDAGAYYVLAVPASGTVSLADAELVLLGERPGDHAGASSAAVGDLDGDGATDLGIGARDEGTGGHDSGAFYVVTGALEPVSELSTAALKLTGEGPEDFAGAHAVACDLDGDGGRDLAVTAHHAGPGPEQGRAYVFYGPLPSGEVSLGAADAIFAGTESLSNVGQDVSCADLDQDGLDDLAIGAEGDDHEWGGDYAGSAYVLFGRGDPPGTTDPTTGPPPRLPPGEGCGCASGGRPTLHGVAALLALARRRRIDRAT